VAGDQAALTPNEAPLAPNVGKAASDLEDYGRCGSLREWRRSKRKAKPTDAIAFVYTFMYIHHYKYVRTCQLLTIRDPRAEVLARRLAEIRQTTMTQAVVTALEQELRRERAATPLALRLGAIAKKATAMAGPNGRVMTKDEIDELSGG
jgi:antitoxin VapB